MYTLLKYEMSDRFEALCSALQSFVNIYIIDIGGSKLYLLKFGWV
jgi:hypothetical protein